MSQITCPHCHMFIDLDKMGQEKYNQMRQELEQRLEKKQKREQQKFQETLSLERKKTQKQHEQEAEELRKKSLAWKREQQQELEKEREQGRKKLQQEHEKWIKIQQQKFEEKQKQESLEMQDLKKQLEEKRKKETEWKKNELKMRTYARELEEKEKNLELEMIRKIDEEKKRLEQKIYTQVNAQSQHQLDEKIEKVQEEFRKKELEYQKQQDQLKKSLDDAQRKAEQGSQQIQGDIQEEDMKQALFQAFPFDEIRDVPTGVKGADLIQEVRNQFGQNIGIIVWESKNTKSWQESWIMKLKEDKLKVSGNLAILVTSTLPKNIKNFGVLDDVMVCSPEYAIGIAHLLRDRLLGIAKIEKSLENKDAKMEMLYGYLSSDEFSAQINMIVDVFRNLELGIVAERRAMEKNWNKRKKDLESATFAVARMQGDLESLMGNALPKSKMFELETEEN